MDATIKAELEKPLDRKHVKPPKNSGPKGDYIESWHAIAEANRIFNFEWSQETLDVRCVAEKERSIGPQKKPGWGVTYTARVRITVGGVAHDGCGAGHGYDVDLGIAHESALKEAESDAEKRALRKFGWPFGLALYDKGRANVSDNPDFNAKAEADLVVSAFEAATTPDELNEAAKDLRPTVEELRRVSKPDFDRVIETFKARSVALSAPKPPKQVAAE